MRNCYYFDMDGVLVYFDEQAKTDKPFNILNSHYFTTCPPDVTAVDVMKSLSLLPGCDVKVLTRVYLEIPDERLLNQLLDEHTADKRAWCERFLDFRAARDWSQVNTVDDFICLRQTNVKTAVLDGIPQHLRRHHVLIDDDPVILAAWVNAGGSAVQFLQPQRKVAMWHGKIIKSGDSVPHAVNELYYIERTEAS